MKELELIRESAQRALRDEQWGEAARLYRLRLETLPWQVDEATAEDATNLGALLRKLGRLKEAVAHYQLWLERFPKHRQLRLNGINCLIEAKDLTLAESWAKDGIDCLGQQPELVLVEARVWHKQGKLKQARQRLEGLLSKNPEVLGAWLELAQLCQRQGDLEGALAANGRVTTLDPECCAAFGNQVLLMKQLGQLEQAKQLIETLPTEIRQHTELRRAAAALWMEQQLMTEAETELAELCRLQPEEASHWLNRAACLRHLKHFNAAVAVLKAGMRWAPKNNQLQESLGHCLAEIGEAERGMNVLRNCLEWSDLEDQSHASLQFVGAAYGTLDAVERQALARAWERRKQAEGVGPLWADRIRSPLKNRRLKVGYLSSDFCNHPVGRFLLPVLQAHSKEAVEVWGLTCGPHQDATTTEIRRACEHWIDLRFGNDLDVARLIADQDLDVLVELGGYTGLSRIGVLVHRPAPVQLSYLGYFAPTYLQAIDGWIGDSALFGRLSETDQEAHRLINVEGGYMCFLDDEMPRPQRVNSRKLRFGSFNHSRKLSKNTVKLFCAVMHAAPQALLVLKSISFIEAAEQERVRGLFEAEGLETERLVILAWVEGRANHLKCYAEIDVALDPTPYGGATTTCEALAMGVPVITLSGEGMVQQLSSSILISAGLSQWIAEDTESYVEIAKGLAQQGKRNETERIRLRDFLQGSNLSNKKRLSQSLEIHYRQLAEASLQRLA